MRKKSFNHLSTPIVILFLLANLSLPFSIKNPPIGPNTNNITFFISEQICDDLYGIIGQ